MLLIEKVASKAPSLISLISYVTFNEWLIELHEFNVISKRKIKTFLKNLLFNPSKFNKIIIFGTYNVIIFFETN